MKYWIVHCSGNLTTQFATEFGSFVFLVTGNLVYKCQFVCRDGSWVPTQIRGLKTTWSGKLSDSYTTAVYIHYKTGRRNCRC